jgi:RNA polymerase sigma-70 factor, ECF subfamily
MKCAGWDNLSRKRGKIWKAGGPFAEVIDRRAGVWDNPRHRNPYPRVCARRRAMNETNLSLLGRATAGDEAAWRRIVTLYQPLISGWLQRHGVHPQEAADLTQEVLVVVVKELRGFTHAGHPGSFRGWLRAITVNRARAFLRDGKWREQGVGGDGVFQAIGQLEDPASPLAREWDAEHDAQVVRQILALVETDFEPTTVHIFRRLVLDEARAPQVAAEVGMDVAAVYGAKSRVLQRIRQEAAGLID